MLLYLDCETRSTLTLQKVGVDRYSRNCELLMLAHAAGDREPDIWLPSESEIPAKLRMTLLDPTIVKTAWNCAFEHRVFRHQLGIDTPISEWLDPSVYARYMGLPSSLALASEYLKLGDTAKDKEGRRLINKFSKPYKSRKTGTYSFRDWNDKKHNPDWLLFQKYCRQDVVAERAIYQRLKAAFTPPTFERKLWELDQKINERGLAVSMDRIREAQENVAREREWLQQELNRLTGLRNANSVGQLLPWLRRHGYPYTSLDREHIARALEPCTP
jgi:DNA polymerase